MPVAEVSKDDVDLGDEELDPGAWGDPDLDLEPGEANGVAEMDHEEGEPGEEAEGGWEMEVCSCLLTFLLLGACSCGNAAWRECMTSWPRALQNTYCAVLLFCLMFWREEGHQTSQKYGSSWRIVLVCN